MFEMVYTAIRLAALVYVRRNEKRVKGLYINKDDLDKNKKNNKKNNNRKNNKNNN